ncbi:unnamed protein product [Moneuplotes crassus]|uniref:Uncharacterized protein n=1 Tax=Euplotes crassus TaxID=5936 RepID=A0AAD1UK62_EUPCR|nr:unnamed protein product [Moneuplotes crassus]
MSVNDILFKNFNKVKRDLKSPSANTKPKLKNSNKWNTSFMKSFQKAGGKKYNSPTYPFTNIGLKSQANVPNSRSKIPDISSISSMVHLKNSQNPYCRRCKKFKQGFTLSKLTNNIIKRRIIFKDPKYCVCKRNSEVPRDRWGMREKSKGNRSYNYNSPALFDPQIISSSRRTNDNSYNHSNKNSFYSGNVGTTFEARQIPDKIPLVNKKEIEKEKNFSSFDNTRPTHRRIKSNMEIGRIQNLYEMYLKTTKRDKVFHTKEDEAKYINDVSSEEETQKKAPSAPKAETLFIKCEKSKGGEYPASLLFMDFNRREIIENFIKNDGSVIEDADQKKQMSKRIFQKFKSKYGLSKVQNQDAKTISNNTKIKMMLQEKIDF